MGWALRTSPNAFLVGYNINDSQLRCKVLQAIHGLRRPERVNWVYRQYATLYTFWPNTHQTSVHSATPKHSIGEG